jgi:hypothetical protein
MGYEHNISELYPYLNKRERNCLHVIYERLKINDEMMDSFEVNILNAIQEKVMADPWDVFKGRLRDVSDSYGVAQELINSFLKGKPIDVFSVE